MGKKQFDSFSVENFVDVLEGFIKGVKSNQISVKLLDASMRGDGRDEYDFTGASTFFKKNFPEFEKLYWTTRGQGLSGKYIKE